jgi:Putative prokaryotic signal transducing protein
LALACDDDDVKKIYVASNLPEAYLVRDLLVQSGVAARVLNEHAMGALGELALNATYPQVWITQQHQEQHARSLIAEYEQRTPTQAKFCGHCGENNPGEFELCWSCGTQLGLVT